MTERTLLPIRLPAVPRLRLPLARYRGSAGDSARVLPLLRCLEESGVSGVAILGTQAGAWPSSPSLVVIHEAAAPEVRASFLALIASRGLGDRGLLCLTPSEWGIWSRSGSSFGMDSGRPLWGAPQTSSAPDDEPTQRRARLRICSRLFWAPFHRALASGSDEFPALAEELRDRLERETSPAGFPPRWLPEATATEIHASVLGALHGTFAGEVAVDPQSTDEGGPPPASAPPRSATAARALMSTLLADLPTDFIGPEVLALYLLPGPVGSRLSWSLLAAVPDEAALDRCAALRFRLAQHLRLLPHREVQSVFGASGGVLVIPLSSLAGMLRRRLFGSPSRRLTIERHRQLLVGEDVIDTVLEGPTASSEDLAPELAGVMEAVQRLWSGPSRACDIHDLFYGRLPALIHRSRTGTWSGSLAEAQSLLAESVDPAQAFAGKEGIKEAWCGPATADLGRGREFLRDRGPMILRLQEVAVEALLAAETD